MNASHLCHHFVEPLPSNAAILNAVCITAIVLGGFLWLKSAYDNRRRDASRVTVVVVGAGPVGLTSALVALHTGRALQVVIYEEQSRLDITARTYQLSFDRNSIKLLATIGVDVANIEGCWNNSRFSTRAGLYLENALSVISQYHNVNIRLRCKFTRETLKSFSDLQGRILVVVCDGANGITSRSLGLNDDVIQHSCNAYGAMATLVRIHEHAIPKRDIYISGLNFDISAYGTDTSEVDGCPGFHFKLLGSSRYRYMTLAVRKSSSRLVKALRVILDRAMMRNIFVKCYNTYKPQDEPKLLDSEALNTLRFSPRLFDVKLFQRLEVVSYLEDVDMFVVAEGDAARSLNFDAASDVNLALRGITSLGQFIDQAACAETDHSILAVLAYKAKHSEIVCRTFLRNGLRRTIFS